MADDTDNLEPLLADLAKYGIGAAGTLGANAVTQQAYQAAIQNLKDRFGDYDKLKTPGFKNLAPDKLGPSALGSIKNDAQSRIDQQAAEAALQNLADRGGLNLADRAALNTQEQTLSRNNAARQNSLKNQFAARGQLGSGAELAMDLANNQNAAQNANQHGEQIAGEAQKRAMQAVLEKAGIARNVSNDQYGRDKSAAEANDAINRYNSSMSMEAQRGNNQLLQEGYGDQLQKLHGETGLTDSLNNALLGSGKQNANTIAGLSYGGAGLAGAVGSAARAAGKGGGGGGGGGGGNSVGNGDTPDAPGTQNTKDFGANLQPDPSDPTTAGTDPTAGGGDTSWGSLLDDGEAYA